MTGHPFASAALAALTVAGALHAAPAATAQAVEIRRTTDGIPHLRAANWHALGRGVGYVQAEDALCTLAEAFITYEGRRSWFFGADGRPERLSTFGRPTNLELDFFWRGFADDAVLQAYRSTQPAELNQLIEGYAAGYNRYLADARRAGNGPRACLDQPWVREISAADIYRRMYSAQLAAGLARFIPEIVNARPTAAPAQADGGDALRHKLSMRVGDEPGLGSNALALGGQATAGHGAVLFGNPHWYWGGPDRFYQMHLSIPGRLNVAGVAFLGIPVVMIGFNEHVAWSHTVSAARRFGLFDLTLTDTPERYRVGDSIEPMRAVPVSVPVHRADGSAGSETRVLHRTRYGPVIDLGGHHPAFGWSAQKALAIRDVNADNFRIFRNFFYWNQARSLDDFIAIQRREGAVPWVNTVAIGRNDARVWYGDVGNAPNVPDALRARCGTALGQAFATVDPLTPVLDGSRADCNWLDEAGAAQPGAMPTARLPGLLRTDYVANMNDSYWLTNAAQPLEGFPAVLGGERQPLSLRTRLGHAIAKSFVARPESATPALLRRLERQALDAQAYSATLFKDDALRGACTQPVVTLRAGPVRVAAQGDTVAPPAPRQVEVAPACRVLRAWDNAGSADARGALLWEAFWERVEQTPEAERYRVPFASDTPLTTPSGLKLSEDALQQALAGAVEALAAQGIAPDEALGARRFVASGGDRLPLYGGCHVTGYFTVTCGLADDGHVGPDAVANSYLQVVRFARDGVEAHTLLAHGQDEDAVRGGAGSAPVRRYAAKDWLRFPFTEAAIRRDAGLSRKVLD
ncbi:penicillin acylase family protein [Chitiniphilus shinanonensis]|uniref:penicillin acylase family protein n=1 Tax=Chitiniphilus shinanonensis TaxID=553088 RepID=UPI003050C4D4